MRCIKATLLIIALAGAAQADDSAATPVATPAAMTLAQLIDRSLSANPDTRAAWQRSRSQVERVGIAKSAYYPTLDASASLGERLGDAAVPGAERQTQLGLSSQWLLWDFGGRRANLDSTQQTLAALQASQDTVSQQVAISAVQNWFAQLSARASLQAAQASLLAAEETAKAARQRQLIGVATREDELQAETALAQARLTLIQRQGELAASAGRLAVVAGYAADTPLALDYQDSELDSLRGNASAQPPDLKQLLTVAQERRPELLAQQLRIQANSSELDRIAAQARPRLSLSANSTNNRDGLNQSQGGQIALTATLPLFTGFQQRHQEALAQSQIAEQGIELSRLQQQVSLDVWLAWQQFSTAQARIAATDSLLAAASESSRAALARYQAGLGNLLNVLTAQSNLADARQQHARSRFDLAAARLQLAQASGLLVRDTAMEFRQ